MSVSFVCNRHISWWDEFLLLWRQPKHYLKVFFDIHSCTKRTALSVLLRVLQWSSKSNCSSIAFTLKLDPEFHHGSKIYNVAIIWKLSTHDEFLRISFLYNCRFQFQVLTLLDVGENWLLSFFCTVDGHSLGVGYCFVVHLMQYTTWRMILYLTSAYPCACIPNLDNCFSDIIHFQVRMDPYTTQLGTRQVQSLLYYMDICLLSVPYTTWRMILYLTSVLDPEINCSIIHSVRRSHHSIW